MYILLTFFTTRMYWQEVSQKLNRALAHNLVADQLLTSQGEVNPYALKELFHQLMVVKAISTSCSEARHTIPPLKCCRAAIF